MTAGSFSLQSLQDSANRAGNSETMGDLGEADSQLSMAKWRKTPCVQVKKGQVAPSDGTFMGHPVKKGQRAPRDGRFCGKTATATKCVNELEDAECEDFKILCDDPWVKNHCKKSCKACPAPPPPPPPKKKAVQQGKNKGKRKPGWTVRNGDFSHCESEKGSTRCAQCDFIGGGLPCSTFPSVDGFAGDYMFNKGQKRSALECNRAGMFFVGHMSSFKCVPFSNNLAYSRSTAVLRNGPSITGIGGKNTLLLFKAIIGKPHGSSVNSGYVGWKRELVHLTAHGREVVDVSKWAVCVDNCPMVNVHSIQDHKFSEKKMTQGKFKGQSEADVAVKHGMLSKDRKRRSIFHSTSAVGMTPHETRAFLRQCWPAVQAPLAPEDTAPKLKTKHICSNTISREKKSFERNEMNTGVKEKSHMVRIIHNEWASAAEAFKLDMFTS